MAPGSSGRPGRSGLLSLQAFDRRCPWTLTNRVLETVSERGGAHQDIFRLASAVPTDQIIGCKVICCHKARNLQTVECMLLHGGFLPFGKIVEQRSLTLQYPGQLTFVSLHFCCHHLYFMYRKQAHSQRELRAAGGDKDRFEVKTGVGYVQKLN